MNLFVYGTLLVPEILDTVTGRGDWKSEPAELPGHAIFRVRNRDFPGIVKSDHARTPAVGSLIFDVDEQSLARLDAYEDDFYTRESVLVLPEAGSPVRAEIYLVPESLARHYLSDEVWTLEWFMKNRFETYWSQR